MIQKDSPLVTIQCLTYNHEPYIRQCLEGFVMQQTDFCFEVSNFERSIFPFRCKLIPLPSIILSLSLFEYSSIISGIIPEVILIKYERTSLWHDVLSIDLSATIIVSCFARLVATLNSALSRDIPIIVLGI